MTKEEQLLGAVMLELRWDPLLGSAQVTGAVKGDDITLTGHVGNYSQKIAAEQAAKRIKGIKAVKNNIQVDLPPESRRRDKDIETAVMSAIRWNNMVPDDKIQVVVSGGRVTLKGAVEWQYQKEAVNDAVKYLTGVLGVNNLIMVKPKFKLSAIKDSIRKALERNAVIEADKITIETEGNEVIIRGKVHSWLEKQIVENAVWSSPGVILLKDELEIE